MKIFILDVVFSAATVHPRPPCARFFAGRGRDFFCAPCQMFKVRIKDHGAQNKRPQHNVAAPKKVQDACMGVGFFSAQLRGLCQSRKNQQGAHREPAVFFFLLDFYVVGQKEKNCRSATGLKRRRNRLFFCLGLVRKQKSRVTRRAGAS